MVRVLLFTAVLIIVVVVLTMAKGFILEDHASGKENIPPNSKPVVEENDGSVRINSNGKLNFESISYDISVLLESDMVKALPKKAVIELKLGNQYYTVSRDSISAGRPSNPDLTISLPASYANQIALGLCAMVKNANENRDLGIEMHSSQTALMWKYKGMLKYKDCLG
ncbi:MAG: hypothetical protein ABH864_06095 [archaeon]